MGPTKRSIEQFDAEIRNAEPKKDEDTKQGIKRAVTNEGANEQQQSAKNKQGQANNKLNTERNKNDTDISGPDIVEYELSSFDQNDMHRNSKAD